MTYPTPDLDTISLQIVSAIQQRLQRDPTLPRSMLGVLGKALSGAVDGLYGDIDNTAKDIIYDTASEPALIRWAGIWGKTLKAPTGARGPVVFAGGVGTVAAGAVMSRKDGIQYSLDADVILTAGVGTGSVTCLSAGAMTNTDEGGQLTLAQPVPGVSSTVTVGSDGLGGGADMESPEELLARLLTRIRETPQGGAQADYEEWALAVSGVTRVWVVPSWNGAGTVGVLFMCDDRANPIPQASDVTIVQAAIDAVRPVTAQAYVVAPTPVPLNFSIQLTPPSAQSAVQSALASLIATECNPIGGTLTLKGMIAAIEDTAGVTNFTMPTPAADTTLPVGSITTMGEITWL